MILETIHDPNDIKTLNEPQTQLLCTELREFLLKSVSKTGGHLASNLGAVELTVAIHRVFDTSRDRLIFDVGHQCYPHKILTGRREQFQTLRQYKGLSGFPKPHESEHDAFIAGHASNSVSVALGMARARTLQHQDYSVLALIGDGALSGGHARALLPLKAELQLEGAKLIAAQGLSVRQTEALAKRLGSTKEEKKRTNEEIMAESYGRLAAQELSDKIGRTCRIVSGKKKGRIELDYYGMDDLNDLLEALAAIKRRKNGGDEA